MMTKVVAPGRRLSVCRLSSCVASIVLVSLVVGPMVATIGKPSAHAWLRDHLAESWERIGSGEAWRLVTSAFVQSHAGFVAGIVVLVLSIPIAEARIGRRVTFLAFFLGDWISTSLVLVGTRVVAAFGSAEAENILHRLDSGASAACFACVGATIASMHRGRLALSSTISLVAVFAVSGAVSHSLADIQHPVAAVTGAGVAIVFGRSEVIGA